MTIAKPLVFFICVGCFFLFEFLLYYRLSFIYLQNFCVHILFHQKGNKLLNSYNTRHLKWVSESLPHVNSFYRFDWRPTIDHSSPLVRNPLLKVWPPLLFAYRSWGWRLFHWLPDSFAPNCHPFLLWTEAHCTKDVCTELHCLLARRCHTSTSAAHVELVGPAPWNFREMNMFLPSPFSSWYLLKVLLGSGGWLSTKKESYGVTACVTALGPRPSSTVP